MSTSTSLVFAGAFLASAVEMVEALTIVLGVGVVRGWRSTLIGAGVAGVVLTELAGTRRNTLAADQQAALDHCAAFGSLERRNFRHANLLPHVCPDATGNT